MLQNAYFFAKIGPDTAENEQHFAEILPIGRRVADRCSRNRLAVPDAEGRRVDAAQLEAAEGRGVARVAVALALEGFLVCWR